ncbi:MAG TPA: aspartyl protease family protein [Candidatus Binatia bacterium]
MSVVKSPARMLLAVLLSLLFRPGPATAAEIFRWTDGQGVVHFTNNLEEIPERFRSTAVLFKTESRLATVPPPPDNASVQFQKKGELMVVAAKLNGKAAARFVVDTGATYTTISQATAKELEIDLGNNPTTLTFHTAGGLIQAPLASIRSIEVGGLEIANLTVAVHDIFPDPGISGLLGLNFLSQFRVGIDSQNSLLNLEKK